MAIKKINRSALSNSNGVKAPVKPVVVEEPVVEEIVEEVVEEVEEEIEVEEEVKPVKASKPVAKTTVKSTNKKVENKGEKKMSKVVGLGNKKKVEKKQEERTIGTVYPKDLLYKNIQSGLEERFGEVSLADCKYILEVIEAKLVDAAQIASVRFLGGVLASIEKNASIAKAPKVDYASFTGKRTVLTIRGSELGEPEKYQGQKVDDTTFEVTAAYNYETKEYEPAEGTLVYNPETNDWEIQ